MSSISGVSGGFRPPPPKPPSFESVDTDSSGGLSIEEFKAGAPRGADRSKSEELFKAIDSDSNGSVTREEQDAFKAKAEQAQQQLQSFLLGLQAGGSSESGTGESQEETDIFAQLDANSDGGVAKDEFLSAFSSGTSSSSDLLSKLFDAIDTGSDGSISKDEKSAFQTALEQRSRPSDPPPGSASQAYGSTYQLGAANAPRTTYSQAA